MGHYRATRWVGEDKICFDCGLSKDASEFSFEKGKALGLGERFRKVYCRVCTDRNRAKERYIQKIKNSSLEDGGWICHCGNPNKPKRHNCPKCGLPRED